VANLSTTQGELVANLPPLSLIPVAICHRVIDTGGKFATVSLTAVVHLDLRISPRIFEKIQIDPNVLSEAWGKVIHEKNLKQKIS
jgi:hypothetical protein